MKIYWYWDKEFRYDFYVMTGKTKISSDLLYESEEVFVISLIGKRAHTNKRRGIKRLLLNPPKKLMIDARKTWIWFQNKDKIHYFKIGQSEFTKLLKTYDINKIHFLIEKLDMKIDLYNRDGNGVWLEKVGEEGWWQLRMAQPSLLNYTRLIFEEEGNEEIYAVDPPGGPFISIGSKWWCGSDEELEVKEIKNTSLGVFLKLVNSLSTKKG